MFLKVWSMDCPSHTQFKPPTLLSRWFRCTLTFESQHIAFPNTTGELCLEESGRESTTGACTVTKLFLPFLGWNLKEVDVASKHQAISSAPGDKRLHAVIICLSYPIATDSQEMSRFLLHAVVVVSHRGTLRRLFTVSKIFTMSLSRHLPSHLLGCSP